MRGMKQAELAAALDVSEYWLMGVDMPMERKGSGDAVEQRQRFVAYAKQMYETNTLETYLRDGQGCIASTKTLGGGQPPICLLIPFAGAPAVLLCSLN